MSAIDVKELLLEFGRARRVDGCSQCAADSGSADDALLVEEFGCSVGTELGLCRGLRTTVVCDHGELLRALASAWVTALREGVSGEWRGARAGEWCPGLSMPPSPEEVALLRRREELLGLARVCLSVAVEAPGVAEREVADARAFLASVRRLDRRLEQVRAVAVSRESRMGEVSVLVGELVEPMRCLWCSAAGAEEWGAWRVEQTAVGWVSWLRVPTVVPGWLRLGPVTVVT